MADCMRSLRRLCIQYIGTVTRGGTDSFGESISRRTLARGADQLDLHQIWWSDSGNCISASLELACGSVALHAEEKC